jgi:hypothetical protein
MNRMLNRLTRPAVVMSIVAVSLSGACTPAQHSARIPPAPVVGQWPEEAFLPGRQCHGRYAAEDLQRFLPRARLALWLPGTRSVILDQERRCIAITVDGIGAGRLAELVLRGVSVPRRSVLLLLSSRDGRG